jgi:hypothetical protein
MRSQLRLGYDRRPGGVPYGRPGGGRGLAPKVNSGLYVLLPTSSSTPSSSAQPSPSSPASVSPSACGSSACSSAERSGYRDHPRLEGGEFSVGHVAEPFRDRIGRKMQIQGLRWTAITAV